MTVSIGADDRARLRHACDTAAPHECCGLLLGRAMAAHLEVRRVLVARNGAGAIGHFAIPAFEFARAHSLAAQWGLDIIAVFHSHPDGDTRLSGADLIALAGSEWPWVVIAPADAPDDIVFRYHDARPASPADDGGRIGIARIAR